MDWDKFKKPTTTTKAKPAAEPKPAAALAPAPGPKKKPAPGPRKASAAEPKPAAGGPKKPPRPRGPPKPARPGPDDPPVRVDDAPTPAPLPYEDPESFKFYSAIAAPPGDAASSSDASTDDDRRDDDHDDHYGDDHHEADELTPTSDFVADTPSDIDDAAMSEADSEFFDVGSPRREWVTPRPRATAPKKKRKTFTGPVLDYY